MLRHYVASVVVCLLLAGALLAADKSVTCTLIKVDVKKKVLIVKTDEGKKEYDVNADTKFIGPKGGISEAGIKDDRLKKGVALKLLVAGNNRTLREVHLPERKGSGGK